MMEKRSIKAILTTSTLAAVLALVGCDQTPQDNQQAEQSTELEQSISTPEDQQGHSSTAQQSQNLSRGNMLNIARDIAKLQIETDDYVTLLKQSQSNLEQAIQDKNAQKLQSTTGELNQQLHNLHDALLSLNLRSDEVDQIRQSLLAANQQLLNMPLLHGQTDLSKIDFAKIEKQFNSIQMDMVKLATLILGNHKADSNA
ncbi:hypothetical protein [Acinetobacter sp. NBRC 110496]|uniref:hypothetical protein n=1 Tax=Acinetobacter sp. NBRC 110496 TaxID=1550715 RepID=UPI0005C52603|nr:hypothetical protein [Acinetobacter sp. NBRC 110496]